MSYCKRTSMAQPIFNMAGRSLCVLSRDPDRAFISFASVVNSFVDAISRQHYSLKRA